MQSLVPQKTNSQTNLIHRSFYQVGFQNMLLVCSQNCHAFFSKNRVVVKIGYLENIYPSSSDTVNAFYECLSLVPQLVTQVRLYK